MIRDIQFNDFLYLLEGLRWTVVLSIVAFTGGTIGGVIIVLCRISPLRPVRYGAMLFIRLIQGTPLLIQLFLLFFGVLALGFEVDPWFAATVGLSINAGAFLGEIWRGCIQSVPHGQWEASSALGLGYYSRMRYVVLPQALRIAYAPTVGYAVQLIKATSVTSIVGFVEMTRAAQVINNVTFQPFLIFGTISAFYFLLCWPLSLLSARLERRSTFRG